MVKPRMFLCVPILFMHLLVLPAMERTEFNGWLNSGFKAINNRGDLNYFREVVGERAGLTLESAQLTGIFPRFRYLGLEALYTPEHNSRVVIRVGSVENFRIQLKFDSIQTYYDTSSTNFGASKLSFSPTPAELFSMPGDLTLRRTVGSVDMSWKVRPRLVISGGYRLRRSYGSALQLVGGSFFSTIDSSLPTARWLSAFEHTLWLGLDLSLGRFNIHLLGEVEKLKSHDWFLKPQIGGIALNRDFVYRDEAHSRFANPTAWLDFTVGSSWYFSGGYLFNDLRNTPQWFRLETNRYFGDLSRRGEGLKATSQFHGVFAQTLYAPQRRVAVRYRMIQEWGEGAGSGWQQRFENPVYGGMTEALESRNSFNSTLHREQVSVNLYPVERATLRATYRYDTRTSQYANYFTPGGLNFTAGASIDDGEQKANVHNLRFEARLRATHRVQIQAEYGLRQNKIRENTELLVRHYFLGDQDTTTNFYRIGLKLKTARRANFVFDLRRENRDYTAQAGSVVPSQNILDFNTYAATLNLHPTNRLFLFGMLYYSSIDTRLTNLETSPLFLTYSPWVYDSSNTGYVIGSRWTVFNNLTVGMHFQQNRAGGTENYLLRNALGSIEYEIGPRWSLGLRYQFFESNQPRSPDNNYHTNLVQALLNYRF